VRKEKAPAEKQHGEGPATTKKEAAAATQAAVASHDSTAHPAKREHVAAPVAKKAAPSSTQAAARSVNAAAPAEKQLAKATAATKPVASPTQADAPDPAAPYLALSPAQQKELLHKLSMCKYEKMSIIMGEGSRWGSWCEETCTLPETTLATAVPFERKSCAQQVKSHMVQGHKKADHVYDTWRHDMEGHVFVRLNNTGFKGKPYIRSKALGCALLAPGQDCKKIAAKCAVHHVIKQRSANDPGFCESFCIGDGETRHMKNAVLMEKFGFVAGECEEQGYAKYLGKKRVSIFMAPFN
jgi:pyruvate/2-oxoglutarate dehydrogenase complex dihydrolipoamide acyltransferase (E2) component